MFLLKKHNDIAHCNKQKLCEGGVQLPLIPSSQKQPPPQIKTKEPETDFTKESIISRSIFNSCKEVN